MGSAFMEVCHFPACERLPRGLRALPTREPCCRATQLHTVHNKTRVMLTKRRIALDGSEAALTVQQLLTASQPAAAPPLRTRSQDSWPNFLIGARLRSLLAGRRAATGCSRPANEWEAGLVGELGSSRSSAAREPAPLPSVFLLPKAAAFVSWRGSSRRAALAAEWGERY